jgi:RNA polymerase sigma factor (sigma-70 family)
VRDADLPALVRAAAGGDERAWAKLVERFAGLVWAVARGHGLDQADAADVSQTTWLRLAEHLQVIREPDRLGAWLATTARRECLRTLRRKESHVSVDECADWMCGDVALELGDEMLTKERDAALWSAFEALSGNCKALLRALLSDPPPSYAELSEVFEMPIGSIGPTRARCLDRLRDRIEPRPVHAPSRRSAVVTAKRRVS